MFGGGGGGVGFFFFFKQQRVGDGSEVGLTLNMRAQRRMPAAMTKMAPQKMTVRESLVRRGRVLAVQSMRSGMEVRRASVEVLRTTVT